MSSAGLWPRLDYPAYQATGHSLHMWAQIVGKFRLANTPWLNHSWHATLYPSARGLATGPVCGATETYEIVFDFIDHVLIATSSDGKRSSFDLEAMSVAAFFGRFQAALEEIGAPTHFHGAPNEVPNPVPFAEQTELSSYEADQAHAFWWALRSMQPVFERYRTGFLGKSSPVHLFWGSFDLAVTRFSGRRAPLHPGGFPALPDAVTQEAYSHEVASSGFWPGGGGVDEAAFYAYAYPVPDGYAQTAIEPENAFWHDALGEFVLPYEAVRTADDPDAALLAFLQSTYAAAANAAGWDRDALDCSIGEPGIPRVVE
ncbi:MAG: DUF5996 family protein [Pseudomonadota bacterium]